MQLTTESGVIRVVLVSMQDLFAPIHVLELGHRSQTHVTLYHHTYLPVSMISVSNH